MFGDFTQMQPYDGRMEEQMKRVNRQSRWGIPAALALCVGFMSGCGGEKAETGSTAATSGTAEVSAKADEPVTLKFIHKFPEDDRIKCFQEIIASFEEAHPNVKIEMTAYGDEEIKDKTRVLLGSDEAPDIFFTWSGERVTQYVRSETALDLTSYIEADPEWKDSFNPSMLSCGLKEDKYYAVPFDYSSKEMIYNKQIFEKYQLEIPETWDEFLEVCETLKQAGVTPLAVGNQYPWVVCHFITTLNTKLVPEDVLQANYSLENPDFTDPGYAEAFNMMKELYDKGYINNDVNSCTYEMSESMVTEGTAAMVYDETQILSKFEENMKDYWGYFHFPEITGAKGKAGYITGGPDMFIVNSECKNPDEAVEFLKYLTSREVQSKICKDIAFLPVVKDAANAENSLPGTLEIINHNLDAPGIAEWLDCVMNQTVADEYLAGCQEIFGGKSAEEIMKSISDTAAGES